SKINGHTFQLFTKTRCDADNFLATLSNIRSQTICLGECASFTECTGVNYEEKSSTCELISSNEMTCSFSANTYWSHAHLNCNYQYNRDCQTLHENDCWQNGVYEIEPDSSQSTFDVYCDMQDGGWTVIQRRYDGSVEFHNQNWTEYKDGFGDVSAEHWLGNDLIHLITNSANYEIKFDLMTPDNVWHYATYSNFSIQNEAANYQLSIGPFKSGTVEDVIVNNTKANKRLNGMKFSTRDRDNDLQELESCARTESHNGGGWWYNSCTGVCPNCKYSMDGVYHGLDLG
ncbi:unnamed protein product, partial [Owenia fusiformis]